MCHGIYDDDNDDKKNYKFNEIVANYRSRERTVIVINFINI